MLAVSAGLHPAKRSFGQWAADNQSALQARLDEAAAQARQNAAVRQLLALFAALRAALQPVVNVWNALQAWYDGQYWKFIEFTEEETKRKWKWQHCTEAQKQFWVDAKAALTGFVMTVVYQALVPPSVFWAVLLPLHLAWILHDNMWTSPITLGILVMAPLKFVPWGGWRFF